MSQPKDSRKRCDHVSVYPRIGSKEGRSFWRQNEERRRRRTFKLQAQRKVERGMEQGVEMSIEASRATEDAIHAQMEAERAKPARSAAEKRPDGSGSMK